MTNPYASNSINSIPDGSSSDRCPSSEADQRRVLSLFDSVCIIVGTIIGAGIFQFPGVVASRLPDIYWFLGVWIAGGIIALIGALCFAELTTTYPDRGGDYGYLKRAWHPHIGFMFSWAAFWIIRPGNIGALAMIFGEFGSKLLSQLNLAQGTSPAVLAIGIVVVVTVLNWLGIVVSKFVQNCLTVGKVLGILIVLGGALAMSFGTGGTGTIQSLSAQDLNLDLNLDLFEHGVGTISESASAPEIAVPELVSDSMVAASPISWKSFWLAMVFVMFAFGGWNDIAFVASEVRNPEKNLLRSLILGTSGVLIIYLLVNISLLAGLGLERLAQLGSRWENPTAAFVKESVGSYGASIFSMLVCVSCLGGINAMIFTSPRIYAATSVDYSGLSWLVGSALNRKGWWRAMAIQAVVTILLIWVFGRREKGIENLVAATAPYFWLFLALTVIGLIVCRIRYSGSLAGFKVPLFPFLPLVFIGACGFMMFQAWSYLLDEKLGWWSMIIGAWVLVGGGLGFVLKKRDETAIE